MSNFLFDLLSTFMAIFGCFLGVWISALIDEKSESEKGENENEY